ncbi:MAG: M42 family metallopeptidase [Chloroflexi bacterium]|nr:M42 family metallopeptidase [Chloroflexota bacterium]
MFELMPFLKQLISQPGLSGYEKPVHDLLVAAWQPLVDQCSTSRLGSLHALRKGQGPEPRPSILLAAHMDAIGLMVTTLEGEFLRFTHVGGVDPRILPGQPVMIYGRRPLPGVVVQPPNHLLPADNAGKPLEMARLLIDAGLPAGELAELVRPGDIVAFDQAPMELSGDVLAGHSLDNRASVAAVTACLHELQHTAHAWDVWAAATVQEEVTLGGAYTSAFALRPSLAIAIDVTFAKGPGASDYRAFPLGKGVALGWGPNIHPAIHQAVKDTADRLEIPYQVEIMPVHSGTDAEALQISAEGVPCMVVSIPLRYMHTPVEAVHIKDVQRAGHLLAAFIAGLEPDFVHKIIWED